MTVSYQYEVASSTSGGFTRLLFMWRGSLYKLIYRELLLFLAAFGVLSALYRNAFTEEQKRLFEKMVVYCDTFINLIPLSFVLGFYVAYVAGRWWQQYMAIPWPDKIMHSVALYVNGNDEHGRILRRTMMRYLNLTLILVLRSISSAVKRRFPTLEHLVEAGFMTSVELEMYSSVPSVEFNTYWIPCTWFISLLKDTRKSNRISDSQGLKIIMEEFNEFRSKCGLLWSYDWVSLPLVYTQVVTIATYSFFLAALVGRQYVEVASRKKDYQMEVDIYIPLFTILQFFFYMGLLKVAEQLINPFGDDDEDFELNWLIDRHTKVAYLGVDTLMARQPPLVKDKYFDDVDLTLPYTEASVAYKKKTYRGSVHNMQVPEEKHTMFLPEITEEDEDRSCPTPKGSVHNLQTAAAMGASAATAAAAGIWRSRPSSSSSLFRLAENMEADTISIRYMEDGLVSPSAVQVSEVNCTTPVRELPMRTSANVARTESDSDRKPSLTLTQWPSSSTMYKSQSFRMSEVSIDMEAPPTPRPSSSPRPSKHHSFSGGEFLGLKSAMTSPNLSESKLNMNRKRAIAAKIKSLPKLVPVKRHSSFGGCVGNSRSKKGVRWKPMTDSTEMKLLGASGSEAERFPSHTRESIYNDSSYIKFNSLESPDVRFKSLDFPVLRIPEQVVICELCRQRVQRVSASPYPEISNSEVYLKHSLSAPNVAYQNTELGYNRDRSHSWQYKVMDKYKNTVRKDFPYISGGLKNRHTSNSATLFSQSAPNVPFLANSLHIELPRPKENILQSTEPTTPEETEEHISPLFQPDDSPKTSTAPNLDSEMDSSSPPTTSDAHDTLQDTSWKSADWTTLLGSDFKSS